MCQGSLKKNKLFVRKHLKTVIENYFLYVQNYIDHYALPVPFFCFSLLPFLPPSKSNHHHHHQIKISKTHPPSKKISSTFHKYNTNVFCFNNHPLAHYIYIFRRVVTSPTYKFLYRINNINECKYFDKFNS